MKKRAKRLRSLLCVLMTALLLVQMLPLQAFAVDETGSTTGEVAETDVLDSEAIILGELVDGREEYVKRFRMSDGTIQAVQYEIPVHYQAEDGSWVEYDKTLTEADALEEDTVLIEEYADEENSTLTEEEQSEEDVTAETLAAEDVEEPSNAEGELETEAEETATDEVLTEDDVEEESAREEEPTAEEESTTEEDPVAEEELAAEEGAAVALTELTEAESETPADVLIEEAAETAESTEEVTSDDSIALTATTEEVSTKEWINISPDFAVRFSKKTNGKKFVRVEVDGHALAWSYQNANKVDGVAFAQETSDDPLVLTNVRSGVIYPGAFDNADLEYLLEPGALKENIVLQNADAASVYTIEYKYNTLTAVQVDDHTVEFRDSNGAAVYVLYAPYMTDANGEISASLTLEITKNKKNSCTIEMTADESWLQDDARAYPVTLDPLLVTGQAWADTDACQSAFISSLYPSNRYGKGGANYEGTLYVGFHEDYGTARSLLQVPTLPTMSAGDKVVHAEIATCVRKCLPDVTVSVYRVLTSWTQSTVCWNSNIQFESTAYEYQLIPEMATDADYYWESFEITELVRGWYSGEYDNYGIMLRADVETLSSGYHDAQMFSSGHPNAVAARPLLIIYYRNMTGYEDYWSYTSVAAGRDGTASVNNYNGNFTFAQPLTLDAGGTLMPVSISAVYNSTASAAAYSSLGLGFQTNYHIFVKENPNLDDDSTEEEQKYKYYFNDSDGTDHYFYFENLTDTSAKDEDGLGYTLAVNSSSTSARYTITDKTGNKMVFNSAGKLVKVQNTDGVTNVIAYDSSGRISTIKDGASRVYTFAYTDTTATSTIASITDPSGRAMSFTYSSGKLTKITFPDSKTVTLSYSSNQLYYIKGIDTTSYVYAYYKSSTAKPIDYIRVGTSGNPLEKYSFTYTQNETTVTDLQGRSYTYQFNDFGQTMGIVSNEDGRAVFMEYYPGNTTDAKANKVFSESKVQYSTTNYVINPRLTSAIRGFACYATTSSSYYTYGLATDYGHTDNTSILLNNYAVGKNFMYQYVDLDQGVYTLSLYYSTKGGTLSGAPTVAVDVWNGSSYETTYNAPEGPKQTDTGEWYRSSVTFELTGSRTVNVYTGLWDNYTTVYIDDIQLEAGYGESSFNMIENNGYTNGTSQWTITSGGSGSTTDIPGFSKYAYLNGSTSEQRSISQTITTSGDAGDVYSFGAWVKANSAPTGGSHHGDDPKPVFQVKLTYYNGSTEVGSETIDANSDVYSWQFVSAESIAPASYTKIKVALVYDYNINKAYMTGAYCNKEQYGQTYTYDDDGNIVSAVDLAETESTFDYNDNNMLTKLVNPSGSSYEYTYNDKNQLTQAVSSDGQTYDFTYDSKGNALTSTISAEGTDLTITSSATYTSNYNFLATLTDQRGSTTSYTYDSTRGTLLTATDPRSTVTTYAYNTNNNLLTSVSAGGQTVSYTYSNDRLTKIEVNDSTTYGFTYDSFGRNTGISVGSTALASYTYTNHLLTKQTYANGTTLNFAYDELDRLSSRWYNDGDYKLEYLYGFNGELAAVLDYAAATRTKYVYDLADRVVSTRTYNTTAMTGTTLLDSVDYTYADETNYLTGMTHYNAALGTQEITYVYGDIEQGQMPDQVYQVNWNGEVDSVNLYDEFGRLTTTLVANEFRRALISNYVYLDNEDGTTTTLVKQLNTGPMCYTYSYDANGNITSISDTTTYEYDALNQLVRENDYSSGFTYVYTYDSGNITSRTKYAYTLEDELGEALETRTWTYGDSSWGDLLTAYNDGTSTYAVTSDAAGNITSISNGTDSVTHTWLGRKLQSATIVEDGVTTTATYSYNAEGQRVKKVVGDSVTNYYYNGDILAGMTIDGASLTFRYDENGVPFSFIYGESEYFYVRNLQGDVAYIVNDFGTIKGYYTYDAWGNVTEIYGSIAELNPIRYRGYVYDDETGYYYLNSRYYDPELCRFISADEIDLVTSSPTDITDKNLFSYCNNNPANYFDISGAFPWAVALAGAVVNVATTYIAAKVTGQEYTLVDGLVAAAAGFCNAIPNVGWFISGAISGAYTAWGAYKNGASLGGAIGCGVLSCMATIFSIGNLSDFLGDGLDLVLTSVVDLIHGTGSNTVVSAVTLGTIEVSQKNANSNRRGSALATALEVNRNANTRIVGGTAITIDKKMSYNRWGENRIYCRVHV